MNSISIISFFQAVLCIMLDTFPQIEIESESASNKKKIMTILQPLLETFIMSNDKSYPHSGTPYGICLENFKNFLNFVKVNKTNMDKIDFKNLCFHIDCAAREVIDFHRNRSEGFVFLFFTDDSFFQYCTTINYSIYLLLQKRIDLHDKYLLEMLPVEASQTDNFKELNDDIFIIKQYWHGQDSRIYFDKKKLSGLSKGAKYKKSTRRIKHRKYETAVDFIY